MERGRYRNPCPRLFAGGKSKMRPILLFFEDDCIVVVTGGVGWGVAFMNDGRLLPLLFAQHASYAS